MNNELLKNSLYRLNLLLSLMDSDEFNYSINELVTLTGIPKTVLYDDIISIMSDMELSIVLYAVDEDYESFEYSKEFVKALRAGKYDDVELAVTVPYQKDISIVLTNREFVALEDFMKSNNLKLMRKKDNYFIKNNISEINDHDYKIMSELASYIQQGKSCLVVYVSRDKTLYKNVVKPLKIVFDVDNNFTYLAFYNERMAFYRLDRIKQVSDAAGEEVVISDELQKELDEKLRILWGAESSEPEHVKIKIYDEFGVADRVKHDLGAKADGHFTGPFPAEDEEVEYYIYEDDVIGINKFAAWVRSYGSSIIVLEPETLARQMVESAEKRIGYYSKLL